MKELLEKYDVPAPRYTSYPTVPFWSETPTPDQWIASLQKTLNAPDTSWSMYLHIPFCESLCTFCGCNTSITRNHKHEVPYVNHILREWGLYTSKVPEFLKSPLKEIHLGGGTPTFLSPESLKLLLEPLLNSVVKDKDFEAAIEVDPRRTTTEHLKVLRALGFNRISMGVQDFDPEVQRIVNRVQSEALTLGLVQASRDLGFDSVNYDLIYGLPKQNLKTTKKMIEITLEHLPDRIALYSFAKVPWIKPAQRLFKDEDLPEGAEKRELYELSRTMLLGAGYLEIGMDHFARPTDGLSESLKTKKLHRNFMGYTAQRTDVLLGLGVSAISETPDVFHQNKKQLPLYVKDLESDVIPSLRGHVLTEKERQTREKILSLMTLWEVDLEADKLEGVKQRLKEPLADGLVKFEHTKLKVSAQGQPFLRNIAMALDESLYSKNPRQSLFSKSI